MNYYRVDLALRADTLARLDAVALAIDESLNGFVVAAVAEYLQRKGFRVTAPKPRRRFRDQSGNVAGSPAYRSNPTPKPLATMVQRAITLPQEWRGAFTLLSMRDGVEARLAVRAATLARLEALAPRTAPALQEAGAL